MIPEQVSPPVEVEVEVDAPPPVEVEEVEDAAPPADEDEVEAALDVEAPPPLPLSEEEQPRRERIGIAIVMTLAKDDWLFIPG